MRLFLAALVVPFTLGCGQEPHPPPPPAPAVASYPLQDVVVTRLAELDALLETSASVPAGEDLEERVEGLLALIASTTHADMHDAGIKDAAALGDAAIPFFTRRIDDEDADLGERGAAVELLAALDSPAAAAALLDRMESAEESWVRTHVAWRLGTTQQEASVPRLIKRLKYENDHDAVIWIARTLAHFGNYTGLSALRVITESGRTPELQNSAFARSAEIAAEAGSESAWELERAWIAGELEPQKRGPRYEREVWRLIQRFTEFQLRGVDDARFILERLDATAATWLGAALSDSNVYVRVHSAQSLERMGPRAAPAANALLTVLAEPNVAPNAAAALGAMALPETETALLEAAASPSADLRLATLRALAGFRAAPTPGLTAHLQAALQEELPTEFHQAAAESLLALGQADDALLERLAGYLTDHRVEPATTERALRIWLTAGEDRADALATWDELGVFDELVVPQAKRKAAREKRAALIRALLGV